MNEVRIRPVRPEDAGALASLWHRVFGDPEELALAFLERLPALGGGVTAERNGELLGAAYAVTDFTLGELRAAYLYAVAVLPEARGKGLGGELTRRAAALGRGLGADLVCTLPAGNGLYSWYEKLLGLRCALYRREERIPCRPGPRPRPLSPEEYGERRELLLAGRPHVRPGPTALAYEKRNCRCFGGDLLEIGGGLAAASLEDGEARIRELLAPEGADRAALAAAVGAFLGAKEVLFYTPAEKGEPYLAADRPFPRDFVWNLALD